MRTLVIALSDPLTRGQSIALDIFNLGQDSFADGSFESWSHNQINFGVQFVFKVLLQIPLMQGGDENGPIVFTQLGLIFTTFYVDLFGLFI